MLEGLSTYVQTIKKLLIVLMMLIRFIICLMNQASAQGKQPIACGHPNTKKTTVFNSIEAEGNVPTFYAMEDRWAKLNGWIDCEDYYGIEGMGKATTDYQRFADGLPPRISSLSPISSQRSIAAGATIISTPARSVHSEIRSNSVQSMDGSTRNSGSTQISLSRKQLLQKTNIGTKSKIVSNVPQGNAAEKKRSNLKVSRIAISKGTHHKAFV